MQSTMNNCQIYRLPCIWADDNGQCDIVESTEILISENCPYVDYLWDEEREIWTKVIQKT